MDWKKAGIGAAVLDVILVNSALIYLLSGGIRGPAAAKKTDQTLQNTAVADTADECGVVCQTTIKRQIDLFKAEMSASQSTTPVSVYVAPTAKPSSGKTATKTRTVAYVNVPGSGNSKSLSWQDLTGTEFYFDKSDYPGLTEAYFEANINLVNGNGKAYVRLYDITHGIGVDGSEMQTADQHAGIMSSGKLNFWAGRNLIRVQAKTLTADTAVYNYGRLKIITEN